LVGKSKDHGGKGGKKDRILESKVKGGEPSLKRPMLLKSDFQKQKEFGGLERKQDNENQSPLY